MKNQLISKTVLMDCEKAYILNNNKIKIQMKLLKDSLKKHNSEFKKNGHWGYVGDLARIANLLSEINGTEEKTN